MNMFKHPRTLLDEYSESEIRHMACDVNEIQYDPYGKHQIDSKFLLFQQSILGMNRDKARQMAINAIKDYCLERYLYGPVGGEE